MFTGTYICNGSCRLGSLNITITILSTRLTTTSPNLSVTYPFTSKLLIPKFHRDIFMLIPFSTCGMFCALLLIFSPVANFLSKWRNMNMGLLSPILEFGVHTDSIQCGIFVTLGSWHVRQYVFSSVVNILLVAKVKLSTLSLTETLARKLKLKVGQNAHRRMYLKAIFAVAKRKTNLFSHFRKLEDNLLNFPSGITDVKWKYSRDI